MKSINHPNIVKLIDNFYEEVDKVDCLLKKNTYLNLIMEYVPYTLCSIIKDNLYCKTFIHNDLIIKYSYGLIKAIQYL